MWIVILHTYNQPYILWPSRDSWHQVTPMACSINQSHPVHAYPQIECVTTSWQTDAHNQLISVGQWTEELFGLPRGSRTR